jgi:transcriptional regulator with XRE-family HTH domain
MGRKPKKAQPPRHYLRAWRESAGLSLETVADRLQALADSRDTQSRSFRRLGVTHGNLSRIERGLVPYNQTLLELLAELYKTDPASLIARGPSDAEDVWSLWQTLTPAEKAQATEIIKLLKRKGG